MPPSKPLPATFFRFSPSASTSPATFSCFSPSASTSPATLGHGATREMVGAAPVCPPERPRSGVSIRKRRVPPPQRWCLHALKCLCITHDAHLLTMDAPLQGDTGGHTGTAPTSLHQTPLPAIISCFCPSAEPLPETFSCFCPSVEPLPAIIFDFVCRQSLFLQPFLVFVRRRSLFRQPSRAFVRRRSLFRRPFLVLVHRQSLFRQPFFVSVRWRTAHR